MDKDKRIYNTATILASIFCLIAGALSVINIIPVSNQVGGFALMVVGIAGVGTIIPNERR